MASPIISHRALQLDALRGIAVVAVIASHSFNSTYIGAFDLTEVGSYAVYGFFVLSGYLITALLLESKTRRDAAQSSIVRPIMLFYARRGLRLYPVYYLTIAGAVIVGVPHVQSQLGYILPQVANWLYLLDENYLTFTGHLWSLSIEAQFYLLLPWAVFLLPRRGLAMLYALLLTVSFAAWLSPDSFPRGLIMSSTLHSLDSLSIGGLLALAETRAGNDGQALDLLPKLLGPLLGLTLVTMVPLLFDWGTPGVIAEAINHEIMNLFFAVLVFSAARGLTGVAGRVLDARPLHFFGTLSYSMYVLHPFAIWVLFAIHRIRTGEETEFYGPEVFVWALAATTLVSWASWVWLEEPLSRLRAGLRGQLPKEPDLEQADDPTGTSPPPRMGTVN